MTQDEIISMAKEAGIWIPMGSENTEAVSSLGRFAALVEAKATAMEESGWTDGNYRAVLAAAPKP